MFDHHTVKLSKVLTSGESGKMLWTNFSTFCEFEINSKPKVKKYMIVISSKTLTTWKSKCLLNDEWVNKM